MTKKEFLELEQFKALPDDAEIVFRTSKYPQKRVPLTVEHCYVELRLTNREFIENQPINVRDYIEKKYAWFLIIEAMPLDFLSHELNMIFDL